MLHNSTERSARDAIIATWAADPRHAGSVLADAQGQLSYSQLAEVLVSVQDHLSRQGVQPEECITVEIGNDLRGAVLLLALMDGGYDVIPLPARGLESRGVRNDIPRPVFSQWLAGVRSDETALRAPVGDVGAWMSLAPDLDFAGPAAGHGARLREPGPRSYWRTSGSLGPAKLAAVSIARSLANAADAAATLGLNSAHRVALPLPVFHRFGFITLKMCLATGASVDLQSRSNLLRYLEREEEFNPDVAFMSPSFCETLNRGRRTPRRYEFVVCGGDRIGEAAFARFEQMHGPLRISYGSSEMGSLSFSPIDMPASARSLGAMALNPHVEGRISATGELLISYRHGFDGYQYIHGGVLDKPGSFEGEWFRTGDLATLDDAGALRVLGRSDFSINRNGLLLPLADVENRLREIPGIADAAVSLAGETLRGRAFVAFVVLAQRTPDAEQQLRDQFRELIPTYAQPDAVRILTGIPKLENGKINRAALAALVTEVA